MALITTLKSEVDASELSRVAWLTKGGAKARRQSSCARRATSAVPSRQSGIPESRGDGHAQLLCHQASTGNFEEATRSFGNAMMDFVLTA